MTDSHAALPPARPAYVLRGHASQVHAVSFSPENSRLLAGDADGWVTSWGLSSKRAVAAWRAHDSAVLGLAWWDGGAVISHGRDSKLVVWSLSREDESQLETALPVDQAGAQGRKPAVLFELTLNTMNFCSFAWCFDGTGHEDGRSGRRPILLAVPHTLDSEAIDIFHLPSTDRLSTIPAPKAPEGGMAMALAITTTAGATVVAAGYESGHVVVHANSSRPQQAPGTSRPATFTEDWNRLYLSNPHSQPILSLAASPDATYFMTASADAVIAKHPFSSLQDAFRDVDGSIGNAEEQPLRITKTKHSGQQGLSIRDDGKLVATAGWDGRMRLYSAKNGKEVAVLKWHREGCYSTAFAHVMGSTPAVAAALTTQAGSEAEQEADRAVSRTTPGTDNGTQLVQSGIGGPAGAVGLVAARRDHKAHTTHWLAAGSKDGKISLWDVY